MTTHKKITSKLVPFEVAKTLAKLGYNELCIYNYTPNGNIPMFENVGDISNYCIDENYETLEEYLYFTNSRLGANYVSAPRLDDVKDWLERTFDVHIYTRYDKKTNLHRVIVEDYLNPASTKPYRYKSANCFVSSKLALTLGITIALNKIVEVNAVGAKAKIRITDTTDIKVLHSKKFDL